MKRQPKIREAISTSCDDCLFRVCQGCKVPGGTCVYRAINGISGHYVGDVLQNAGLITDGVAGGLEMIVRISIESLDENDTLIDSTVVKVEVPRGVMMATKWEDIYAEMAKKALMVLGRRCNPSAPVLGTPIMGLK